MNFLIATTIFIALISNPVLAHEYLGADSDVTLPIDDYVWVWAAIGLVYVFLKLRAFKEPNE